VSLGYLIVAGSLLGFTAYIFLLGATTPARASTYAYVNPVVAVLLGWLFAGETLTVRTMVAATIIVAAVALIIRRGARRSVAPAEENIVPLRAEGGRR
jgi:drug/metabolite transporter (DMT)-like permease